MKHLILLAAALFCRLFTISAQPFSFPGSDAASIGVYIADLNSGKVIADHNSAHTFIPASVTKCITAASALRSLPADFRFTTEVRAYGKISGHTLHGNIVIIGGGDPTIGSRHFPGRPAFATEFVGWLRDAGIDSIAGSVLVSQGKFPEIGVSPYWLLEDTPWEYGAGYYGINYRDNSFNMTVSPTGIVSMSPEIGDLSIEIDLEKGSVGNVEAMRGEGSDLLYIYGTITGPSYGARYSMPRPADILLDDVMAAMRKARIGCSEDDVTADTPAGITPLRFTSPLATDILRSLMVKSNNLFAEAMLRSLARNEAKVTDEKALRLQRQLWTSRDISFADVRILDGCGLAPGNKFSPRFLAAILSDMAKSQHAKKYTSLFPLAGKEGTVRGLLAKSRLAGKFALKSGSMSGVLCYAGYKLGSTGTPTHVVVIMVNGFTGKSAPVRTAIANYLLKNF